MFGTVATKRNWSVAERKIIDEGFRRTEQTPRLQMEPDFLFLRHQLKGRSPRHAIELGYRNLQCCVGLLNLSNGIRWTYRSGAPLVPLGNLLLASTAVLIDPKRKTIGDWVVESHYPHAFKQSFSASSVDLSDLATYTKRWVRQIKRTDFSDRLTNAIILFQEGLSANQIDVALIKFWTCIEMLCARPNQRESLDRALDRASSIFRDQEVARLRLSFIAESRHTVVHRGEYGDHARQTVQYALLYASEIIGFCAFNVHGLRKHSEILDYLSTPRSPERLKEILKIHRLRLKQISKKKDA